MNCQLLLESEGFEEGGEFGAFDGAVFAGFEASKLDVPDALAL